MSSRSINYLGGNYYISAASLLLEYRMFIDSHPTLFKINTANPYWPKLVYYCEELEKSPELMCFITKIHIDSQIGFERALFCSWSSLLIAGAMGLSEIHQRTVFCGGLLQDIGKYTSDEENEKALSTSIKPLFKTNNGFFDKDNHPLISAKFAEKNLPELTDIAELILHHHAKYDGTGYPKHINESQLGVDNQIIIVANEISDRLDVLGGHNQIAQVIPNLSLCSLLYFKKVHNAWITLLEEHIPKTDFESKIRHDSVNFEDINPKIMNLEKLLSCLLVISSELVRYDFDLKVHALRSIIRRLACLSADTGLFDPVLFNKKLETEPALAKIILKDITIILIGMPEILSHLKYLVDAILKASAYEINKEILLDGSNLLYKNIKALEGKRCSIFR